MFLVSSDSEVPEEQLTATVQPIQHSQQTENPPSTHLVTEHDVVRVCQQAFASMEADEQLKLLSDLFSAFLKQRHPHVRLLPLDFLKLVVLGLQRLHDAGRANVIYLLAKALGTTRPDGSDSLLPTSRMPMGLLEYMVEFFTASSVQQVNKFLW